MNKLDNIFKKGLDGKGLKYSDKHWKQLQQQLNKDQKSRKGLFWILPIGFLFIVLGLYFGNKLFQTNANNQTLAIEIENQPIETQEYSNPNFTEQTTEISFSETETQDFIQQKREVAIYKKQNGLKAHSNSREGKQEASKTSITASGIGSKNAVQNKNKSQENSIEHQKVLDFKEVYHLNTRTFGLLLLDSLIEPIPFAVNTPLRKLKSKWYRSVNPFISMIQYNKKVDVTDQSGYKTQEITRQSGGYGIYLFARKKRFAFKTGLASFDLKEVTNYTNTIHHWDYSSTYIVENDNYGKTRLGTPIILIREIVDSTLTTYQETAHPNSEVKFSYLTVPVQVQYEFGRKRWACFTGLGFNFSFLRSASGIYATDFMHSPSGESQLSYQDISSRKNITQTLVDGEVNAGIKYRVTKNTALLMSYAYTQSINSMMSTYSQQVMLHQMRFGVEIGIW